LALSPQLGGQCPPPGFRCSAKRIPCSWSQGIRRYDFGNARETQLWIPQQHPGWEHCPVFSVGIRETAPETSSPQTPPTAIESASAETFPRYPDLDRENPVVSRGFGDRGHLIPNRRRRLSGSMSPAARGYLCCQFRRFGLVIRLAAVAPGMLSACAARASIRRVTTTAGSRSRNARGPSLPLVHI
jgi:hypothetical protein